MPIDWRHCESIVFHFLDVIKMWIYLFGSTHSKIERFPFSFAWKKWNAANKHIRMNVLMVKQLMSVFRLACMHWTLQTIYDPIHIPFYIGMYLKWLMIHHLLRMLRLNANTVNGTSRSFGNIRIHMYIIHITHALLQTIVIHFNI